MAKKYTKHHVTEPGINVFDDQRYAAEQYHKNYEFKEKKPVRYPGGDWEYEYLHSDESHWDRPLNAVERKLAFETGTPHSYGHRGHQVKGNLRLSGSKRAHQIGKR